MSPSLKLKLSYFGALLVASVCGTSYLFSAYSTALADRLGFNSVQINTIGSAANYGVYLSTPIFGYIVDNYGPQRTCFYTSFLSFTGFFCLAMTYEGYLKPPSFVLCAVYLFLAGVASSAGFVSAIGTVAKNFKSKRGIAFGFPVALFGLSAFLLAQINNFIFKENTFGFLIFLAIITGSSIFIGSWLLIVIPPSLPGEVVDSDHNNRGSNNNENLPSLNSNEGPNNDNRINQLEDAPLINNNHNYNNYNNDDDNNDDDNNNDDDDNNNNEPDIGGWEFVQNGDMLFLSSIILLLAGTGLMYINNVGAVIKYLYSQDLNDHEDNNNFTDFSLTNSQGDSPHDAIQKLQNLHVSLISFSSSVGRISAGILSDITKERFNIRRIFYLILSGIYLLSGHTLMGFFADSLTYLYPASILIGLGFGTMFSILPIIISEWFGSRRFGSNWGTVSAFAGLGGQVFNLYFGYNNDLRRKNKCFGTECYRQAFYLSVIGLVICIGITIRLLYRRIKRDSYQQLQNINYY